MLGKILDYGGSMRNLSAANQGMRDEARRCRGEKLDNFRLTCVE